MKKHFRIYYILYLIYGFGVLWHLIPFTKAIVMEITPAVLLLSIILVLYPDAKNKNYKLLLWLFSVYVFTFLIEAYGVYSGYIFGDYFYGSTLGFSLLNVPFIIGINWAVIIWGSSEIASRIKTSIYGKILIASSFAVVLDFLIEPIAVKLDYWHWAADYIPLQNYAAWFVIAIIFSSIYFVLKVKTESSMPVHFYISQVLFFGMLNIYMG